MMRQLDATLPDSTSDSTPQAGKEPAKGEIEEQRFRIGGRAENGIADSSFETTSLILQFVPMGVQFSGIYVQNGDSAHSTLPHEASYGEADERG